MHIHILSKGKANAMIYYFSGTGNSKWIAEELAQRVGDEAKNLAAQQGDEPITLSADQSVGIVFPIYAWGVPPIVERFCRRIRFARGVYAYAVCTCGDEAGLAMRRFQKIFPYQAAWSFAMPNNYVIGFDVDSPKMQQEKIDAALQKLPSVAQNILSHICAYDVHEGAGARVKTALVRPMFNAFACSTKPFSAEAACNGCGLCARICPVAAIAMENGRPIWVKKRCTQCLGCLNRCPQRAIQYGSGTAKRGRYTCKGAF